MGISKDASADELRTHLQDKMETMVGTRDLEEANRRADTLIEWRFE